MIKLHTLGGVCVADEAGQPLAGAATQRRLLGLLLALAVAGERGLSRDKLLALLWPEAEAERARHSLTQLLYAARKALGADDLFITGSDIRLNRERLTSDVQELQEALEAGDLERATALSQGPFADGFYLPGSTEFESWCSLQRRRLDDCMAEAFDRLAHRLEEAGQPREALGWRKRLAALRPLDASATVALMTTLAQSGDRAGALQHAQLHETLLREEFGLDPDPVVTSLATRLRAPIDWQTDSLTPSTEGQPNTAALGAATVTESVSPDIGFEALEAPDPTFPSAPDDRALVRSLSPLTTPASTAAIRHRHRLLPRRIRWWVFGVVGVMIVLGTLLRIKHAPAPVRSLPAPLPRLAQTVVVAPFRVAGASASLTYLRDGMVELLSARLADDSSARSVDAGAVLAAWRAAGLASSTDMTRDTVVRLAAQLGAERVVIGSVVGTARRVVVTATAVNVPSGSVAGETTVEGSADSISSLVDRLAASLLLLDAGEDASLSSQMTRSLRALRAFLDGQASFRRGNYITALRQYEMALHVDPAFALAALQLAHAADRVHATEPLVRAIAIAWRERENLDERARALLMALAGPQYPAPSTTEEQVAAWEWLIDLTPDRAEPWYELGAHLLRLGDDRSRAVPALQRALKLEPTHIPTRELLRQIDRTSPRAGRPDAMSATLADSGLPLAPFLRWRAAVASGDSTALRTLRDTFRELGPRNLRAIAMAAQVDAVALGDAHIAVEQLHARGGPLEDRFDAALAEHALALNEGRLRDAYAVTSQLAELQPGAHAHLRLRVLDALYGGADSATAETAVRALQRSMAAGPASATARRAVQLADACVVIQWRLAHGDTTEAQRTSMWLRADPLTMTAAAPPVSTPPLACAALIDAALAVTLHPHAASDAVARLDSLAFTGAASGDAVTYRPILVARLHMQTGDARAALAAIRRRNDMAGWPRYLATALREEGTYATLTGTTARARQAYVRYLRLRTQPDPELRAQVREVRRAYAGTSGAPMR